MKNVFKVHLQQLDNAVAIQGDLSIEADRLRIAEDLKNNHPEVNIIINNAGAAFAYLLNETQNAHEKAAIEMNTNYFSVIHFTELLLPHLLQKKDSAVINISSIAVFEVTKCYRLMAQQKRLYTATRKL